MLKNKVKETSLKKELFAFSILAFLISILFFQIGTNFGLWIISEFYNTDDYINRLEEKYISELQQYIDENNISIKDLSLIDEWVLARDDVYIKLFYKDSLIYDTMYGAMDYSTVPSENIDSFKNESVYVLEINNEFLKAIIFCYDFRIETYLNVIMIIASFTLFIILMFIRIHKKINYLITIASELKLLANDLNTSMTFKGNDEIYQVAKGIDYLRLSIIEKIKKEKDAFDTNMNLITSLSHDIKTPLTSVIAYIELAIDSASDKKTIDLLKISLNKSNHLKNITNEIFDHFLLHSDNYNIIFEEVNANDLIIPMLEENLVDLELKGVTIVRNIEDINSKISVNTNLIYRVFENVFSNIEKYADLSKPIMVTYYLKNSALLVSMKNYKKKKQESHSSSKIGLNNCIAIMDKHHGKFDIFETDKLFKITLMFPLL